MEKVLIIVSVIFFNVIFAQNDGQKSELKVRYFMVMASDSTLIKNESEASVFSYSLLCNAKKSIYADESAKSYYDYLRNNAGNYGVLPISSIPKSKSSIYKDGDKIIATLPIGRKDLYRFEEPLLKWELIKNKEKMILSYPCHLAKTTSDTGKVYYAWYTSAIPISEGPFRFKGLNGLVLEVYNEEKSIFINAVEIIKTKELIEPLKYVKIYDLKDKSQFMKKRREVMEDPNIDNYQSKYRAETMDGQEIKMDRRYQMKKIKENNILD
jgi:GLPGLI family protein